MTRQFKKYTIDNNKKMKDRSKLTCLICQAKNDFVDKWLDPRRGEVS